MPIYSSMLDPISASTAITLLQLRTSTSSVVEILRVWVGASTTTSTAVQIQFVRKTASATGTTSASVYKLHPNDPAASASVGTFATGEGTDGDVLYRDTFNALNGWLYLPVPEERITIGPSAAFGIKLPVAPTATVLNVGITWREMG